MVSRNACRRLSVGRIGVWICALAVWILALNACTAADTPAYTDTDTGAATETVAASDTHTDTEEETVMETERITETEAEMETETVAITETETEVETVAETETTGIPVAGADVDYVRDGTPKKYITISFDDGITQDARIMELFRKHGLDNCTFFVNTGLGGANWSWVGEHYGRPDVPHLRYTVEQLKTGLYDGFDMECHTLTHPSLKNLSAHAVVDEVQGDADNILEITGIRPVGISWPGGDTEWNDNNLTWVYEKTDIRFGRAAASTLSFDLPEYFLKWYPTCSFVETLPGMAADGLLDRFLAAPCEEDMLFYVWGHGYELDIFGGTQGCWSYLDAMLEKIAAAAAEDEDIVLVTNAEFYQLFKDDIPAWKEG